MLYRDYSRAQGQWIPNIYGGRENLEAIGFLRHFNAVVGERCAGAITVAEEFDRLARSVTADPRGRPRLLRTSGTWAGCTTRSAISSMMPVHRPWHHNDMTFGLLYAFAENFVLPLSHDEVVYGKRSLIGKMPGDNWQRFANLRSYFGFMWGHPGKKLLFMGGEIAQEHEWNHDSELDWGALEDPLRRGVQRLLRDLNRLYAHERALHQRDAVSTGFRWVVGDDRHNSVFAFLRYGEETAPPVLVVCNMTPVPRSGYGIGVPRPGHWRELLNTDSASYAGSNIGNGGMVETVPVQRHGEAQSLEITLPPLATVFLRQGD